MYNENGIIYQLGVYVGAPFYFIDKVIYDWNYQTWGTRSFSEFQSGQASSFAWFCLLSPFLVLADKEYFWFVIIGIGIVVIWVNRVLEKLVVKSKFSNGIEVYIKEHPGKSRLITMAIMIVLASFALSCFLVRGPWH